MSFNLPTREKKMKVDLQDPEDVEEGDACPECGIGEYVRMEPPNEDAYLYQNMSSDQRDKQMFCNVCLRALFEVEDL